MYMHRNSRRGARERRPADLSTPPPRPPRRPRLVVVQLEAHAVVNLIVVERDVVLVHGVPLLDPKLLRPCACLRSKQLFQVANCVIWVALDADFLAEAVVADHLD